MKKQFTLLSSALILAFLPGKAQITINTGHINTPGHHIVVARDSTPDAAIAPGSNGAGQHWDFTSLGEDFVDTIFFIAPAGLPRVEHYPTTNLALDPASEQYTWIFMENSPAEFKQLGMVYISFADAIPDTGIVEINRILLKFPASLNSTYNEDGIVFSEKFEYAVDPDGAGPHPAVDSVWFSSTIHSQSIIGAEGAVHMPNGNYDALRQDVIDIYEDSVFMYTGSSWSLISPEMEAELFVGAVSIDTNYTWRWWTNLASIGFPLVAYTEFYYSTDREVEWVKTGSSVGIAEANESSMNLYPNPADDVLNIELNTTGSDQHFFVVYSMSGQKMKETTLNADKNVIRIDDLPSGFYLYQVLGSDRQVVASGKVSVR